MAAFQRADMQQVDLPVPREDTRNCEVGKSAGSGSYQLMFQKSVVTAETVEESLLLQRSPQKRSTEANLRLRKQQFLVQEKFFKQHLLPEPEEQQSWSQRLVFDWRFRWLVGGVVVLNMLVISVVESIWEYQEIAVVTLTVERVALIFYIVEWLIRVHAGQLRSRPAQTLLDLALIVTGALALFIPNDLCVICATLQRYMLTVRVLRLLKLMNLSKEMQYFHTFWVLLDDMIYAGKAFVAAVVFILIIIAVRLPSARHLGH